MAALQPTERSRFGYKRAAKAIVYLPMPVTDLVTAGTLREVPFVGPASARIDHGVGRAGPVADRRGGRREVREDGRSVTRCGGSARRLSQSLRRWLRRWRPTLDRVVVSKADYRGDFQMHSTWSDGARDASR